MTVTNIVGDWIQAGYVEEKEVSVNAMVGRNPVILDIADNAPLAMGLVSVAKRRHRAAGRSEAAGAVPRQPAAGG